MAYSTAKFNKEHLAMVKAAKRKELTECRAADREKMVQILTEIAEKHGATLERTDCLCDGKQLYFYIHGPRGLSASLDFSMGSSQPDTHVIAWFIKGSSEDKLVPAFGLAAGGTINSFHKQKCTAVQYGFDALQHSIAQCLELAVNGRAFLEG